MLFSYIAPEELYPIESFTSISLNAGGFSGYVAVENKVEFRLQYGPSYPESLVVKGIYVDNRLHPSEYVQGKEAVTYLKSLGIDCKALLDHLNKTILQKSIRRHNLLRADLEEIVEDLGCKLPEEKRYSY
jgi:hypothetical protein